jgi:hypothetical protein
MGNLGNPAGEAKALTVASGCGAAGGRLAWARFTHSSRNGAPVRTGVKASPTGCTPGPGRTGWRRYVAPSRLVDDNVVATAIRERQWAGALSSKGVWRLPSFGGSVANRTLYAGQPVCEQRRHRPKELTPLTERDAGRLPCHPTNLDDRGLRALSGLTRAGLPPPMFWSAGHRHLRVVWYMTLLGQGLGQELADHDAGRNLAGGRNFPDGPNLPRVEEVIGASLILGSRHDCSPSPETGVGSAGGIAVYGDNVGWAGKVTPRRVGKLPRRDAAFP